MARDKITEYDSTASNNTVCGDVNIAENSALPSDMNNFAREIMSHLKEGLGSGTPLYVDQTNNRLGINTSSPSVDLEISGGLSVDGGTIKLDGNYPTGTNNVALGNTALDDSSLSGNNNTAIGTASLSANTSGSNNVGVGWNSLLSNTTGANNVAIGQSTLGLNSTASDNTAVGYQALSANTTGDRNVAIGSGALDNNTVGDRSVAVGYHSLTTQNPASNTDMYNTAVGHSTLSATTTGVNNTAVGGLALTANTTASHNTAFGSSALYQTTTGEANVAVGREALTASTTGTENAMLGYRAGYAITTGSQNSFIGSGSGGLITTGTKNTIIGRYNGNQGGLDIRTSSNNIVLSDGDGNPRAYFVANGDFYCPRVYAQTTGTGANVAVNSNGIIARSTSSLKYKNTINDATHGLTELLTLRSVTYKGNNDGDTVFGGLIAEEVHDAGLTEFVQYNDDGEPDALAYGNMVSLCIKAIQELKTELDSAKARIATLEGA